MYRFILPFLGMAMTAIPVLALPGTCVTGTYTSYVALSSGGCQDGDATFSNFSPASLIAIAFTGPTSDQIEVIPGGTMLAPTLTFVYLNSAGAPSPVTVNTNGQQFQMGINFQMVLTGAILSDIQMNSTFGNTMPGSASSTKTAEIGAGPTFVSTVSDQGVSNASGSHPGAVIPTTGTGTWTITDGISLQAQNGSVTQSSFENLFTLSAVTTATPDAGTVLSIGTGLICLGLIGRRKLKPRD